MSETALTSDLLGYTSGFNDQINEDNLFTENRDIARKRVSSQLAYSFSHGETRVIRSLPGTGKTYSVLKQAVEQRRTVVLGLQNYKLIDEKAQEAREEHGADVLTVRSAYQVCPSYTGKHGERLATRLRNCTLTPGRLHELSLSDDYEISLPCTDSECPYLSQFSENFDVYDLVVTTHGMLHATSLIENRDVVIDEYPGDVYVTEINNPRGVVNHFLGFINSPAGTWGEARKADDMPTYSSHNLQKIERERGWELECVRRAGKVPVHADANRLVHALAFGTRRGQNTHVQITPRTEVLITGDSAKILNRPDFTKAHSVVGLDATASELMWRKFCHSEMEVTSVLSDEAMAILWEQSGGELAVVGNYAQHASGGNISEASTKRIQDILKFTHGKVKTFSTKAVKDRTEIDVDGYYGRDEVGTNEFRDADTLLLVGAPHPGDDVIRETVAWFGENVSPPRRGDPRRMGVNLSYGTELADEIFSQFREARVEQAIFRGNRLDGSGLTVLSTTACVPEWMPVVDELPMPRKPGDKELAVLKTLEVLGSATTREIEEYVCTQSATVDGVTDRHARRTLKKYENLGVVGVGASEEDGRAKLWTCDSLSIHEIPEKLSDIVCIEFFNGVCPISLAEVKQAAAKLMNLGWADLDWAEWIARKGLTEFDSGAETG